MKPLVQNPDFWVLYKPAGISFHSESGEPGFFEQARRYAFEQGVDQLYPVHRLDKVTSGLLLAATNEKANQALCKAFAEHRIEKYYLAISDSKPIKKQGLIKGDMQPARNGAWKLTKSNDNPAITQFFSYSMSPGKRLFILKPRTGKTHQLRVAMKSLGTAIVGDQLYAGKKSISDRCYLHAYSIGFELAGKYHRFTSLPLEGELFLQQEFLHVMDQYKEPWALSWPVL